MATNRFLSYPVTSGAKLDNLQYIWASHLQSWDVVSSLVEYGGSDATLNEDYSSTATHCVYTPTTDVILSGLIISLADSDVAQNAQVNDFEKWIGAASALTNGLQLRIMDSTYTTTVLDITPSGSNIKTLAGLAAFSTRGFYQSSDVTSATTGNNNHCVVAHIGFPELYGGCCIGVPYGKGLSLYLNDNFSGLATFGAVVYGRVLHS